tara:strand:+ start:224 stop:2308 length:2085 start_codon:yes stop_codon:yes gene_type:complete
MADKPYTEEYHPLVGYIRNRFQQTETSRLYDEKRWLKAYRNYRGLYGPEMAFRSNEKSKVFVKITKTKVLASFGQIIEVLFAQGKFPLGVSPTSVPENIAEKAHLNPKQQQQQQPQQQPDPYGFNGDGANIPPGATVNDLMKNLNQEYENLGFEEGPSSTGTPQIEPARMAAEQMQKLIHDQLEESKAITIMRHIFFEMALLGTGILKGPFTDSKEYNLFSTAEDDEGNVQRIHATKVKAVPSIEAISCWDFYPDPNATNINDCEYVIQRHSYNKAQFENLGKKPMFNSEAIQECLEMGPNYQTRGFESSLYDRENITNIYKNRFEILEYWGTIDKKTADECGLVYDTNSDVIHINAWVCGNKVLRLIENPFTPVRLPYLVCPYELNPYQFFGIGIPENMEDSQQVMNGHARMAIDNLALAGNLVFDVDETMLVPGQDMKVFPGKIFRRQSGQPGAAIHGLKFPNTAYENLQMFDKFRQLADEATGIPSYSHGATGIQSTTRTAAGMSMLMGAAALSIKTVIKNIDDYLLKPLGESLFHWNMQFNDDSPHIIGDLEIKAQGTASLMQKEVRSQRLMTFMQTASNPALAPFVRWHTCLKEIAKSLDIDPDQLINDPDKAAIYAQIMGMANGNQNNTAATGRQDQMGQTSPVPPGASPTDPTGAGGGNIGTGNAPMPGEAGFSAANTQPGRGEQTQ